MPSKADEYKIRTDAGILVTTFENRLQAEASAKERNERAERMGLKVRYLWVHEPAS